MLSYKNEVFFELFIKDVIYNINIKNQDNQRDFIGTLIILNVLYNTTNPNLYSMIYITHKVKYVFNNTNLKMS